MMMFDEANIEKHIGTEIKYRDRVFALKEVEEYLIKKAESLPVELSHDCTADEFTFYKTLNYTTYAGLFIMHPLSYAPTMFQMYDAKADNKEHCGHINWIIENLKNDTQGKYVTPTGDDLPREDFGDIEAVAVFAGSNKFMPHTSQRKLRAICKMHGSKLVLKPHPISKDDVVEMIKHDIGDAQIASPNADLYSLIHQADVVYTTHISETALTSLILGKTIAPLDRFHNRLIGSYSHINHFCFSEKDAVFTLDKIFASEKSGVIHPEVDENWQKKVDDYLDYTLTMRALQENHYME